MGFAKRCGPSTARGALSVELLQMRPENCVLYGVTFGTRRFRTLPASVESDLESGAASLDRAWFCYGTSQCPPSPSFFYCPGEDNVRP